MLKRKLVLFAVAAALICSFVLLSVSDSIRPIKPARASAETSGAGDSGNRSPASRPATQRVGSRRGPRSLTPEREQKVLAWLEADRPGYYQRLVELRETNPHRYSRLMPSMENVMRRQQQMPPMVRQASVQEREHQVRVSEVIRRMRRATSDSERAELSKELEQAVSDHFEAEQNLRGHRLNHLEDQIRELRQELDRTRRERLKIIAERLARWLRAAKPIAASTMPDNK